MPLRVVWKNLTRHPLRTLLTAGSLAVAIFLLSTLHAFLNALDAGISDSRDDRAIVQSAVSLFVGLPLSYQSKIESVPGVETSCKWQWFGGYYQDEANFFSQFGVDQDTLCTVYPEIEVVAGSLDEFQSRRTACMVAEGLCDAFQWKLGDRVPITSNIFVRGDRSAWEFDIAAIYRPARNTIDNRTLFFHFDLLDEALDSGLATGPRGTSTYSLELEPGADPARVMASVDALFENGPSKTDTVPQAVFNAQFTSMWGNVPQFVSAIGLGVFAAVLLACINTMLLAARQQTHDIGIMKALGFTNGAMSGVLFLQSIGLAALGGGLGLSVSLLMPRLVKGSQMESFFPGVGIDSTTLALAIGATALVGVLAGAVPAWRAGRLSPVAALRSEE